MITRNPSTIWYVVADGSRARIVARRSDDTVFTHIIAFISATSHAKTADLGVDEPSRTFESAGGGRHAIEPRTDLHDKGEVDFARLVATSINEGAARGEFQHVALVAPPHAHNNIQSALSSLASHCLINGLSRNLTKIPEFELRMRLLEIPVPS